MSDRIRQERYPYSNDDYKDDVPIKGSAVLFKFAEAVEVIIASDNNPQAPWLRLNDAGERICFYCGQLLDWTSGESGGNSRQVEHLFPISIGGQRTNSNLVWSCRTCNAFKKAKYPIHWITHERIDVNDDVAIHLLAMLYIGIAKIVASHSQEEMKNQKETEKYEREPIEDFMERMSKKLDLTLERR